MFIKPYEETAWKLYYRVLEEAVSRKAFIVTVSPSREEHGETIETLAATKILSPIASIVPLQLLAYHLGKKQGLPIDTPPGLAKAITT